MSAANEMKSVEDGRSTLFIELRESPLYKSLETRLQRGDLCMHPGTCSSSYSGGEPCSDCEYGCLALSALEEVISAIDDLRGCNCHADNGTHDKPCIEREAWVTHLKGLFQHGL